MIKCEKFSFSPLCICKYRPLSVGNTFNYVTLCTFMIRLQAVQWRTKHKTLEMPTIPVMLSLYHSLVYRMGSESRFSDHLPSKAIKISFFPLTLALQSFTIFMAISQRKKFPNLRKMRKKVIICFTCLLYLCKVF